jgi:hypothetical protein
MLGEKGFDRGQQRHSIGLAREIMVGERDRHELGRLAVDEQQRRLDCQAILSSVR